MNNAVALPTYTSVKPRRIHQRSANSPSVKVQPEALKALTLEAISPQMLAGSAEYVLFHHALVLSGKRSLTREQFQDVMAMSYDTADRAVRKLKQRGEIREVDERSAKRQGIRSESLIVGKSAERPNTYGAAIAKSYEIVPLREIPYDDAKAIEQLQVISDWHDPETVNLDEAKTAGLDQERAQTIHTKSEAISTSAQRIIVEGDSERAAQRQLKRLRHIAKSKRTPFTYDGAIPDVATLRLRLAEALIEANCGKPIRLKQFALLLGVHPDSVPKIIKKSADYIPSRDCTFLPVMLAKVTRESIRRACRQNAGAAVAFIDSGSKNIAGISATIPENAAGVRVNQGKIYRRLDEVENDYTPFTPFSDGQDHDNDQDISPEQAQAQRAIKPKIRGCLLVCGWRRATAFFAGDDIHPPRMFKYWHKDGVVNPDGQPITFRDDFDGLIAALLAVELDDHAA